MKFIKWFKSKSKAKKIIFIVACVLSFIVLFLAFTLGIFLIKQDIITKTMTSKLHDFFDAHKQKDIRRIAAHYYPEGSDAYNNLINNPQEYYDLEEIQSLLTATSFEIRYVHYLGKDIEIAAEVEFIVDEAISKHSFYSTAQKHKGKWTFSLSSIINAYQKMPHNNSGYSPTVIVDKSILSYTVGEGETIDHNTFSGCNKLLYVNFPKDYEQFDTGWFYENKNLIAINFDEGNPNLSSVDGVVFNKDGSRLLFYPRGKIQSEGSANGVYNIPSFVKSVAERAFQNCVGVRTINVPSSVTTIEQFAFQSADNLTAINFSEGLQSLGNEAFESCLNIKSLVFPSTLKTIGKEAFHGCFRITSVTFGKDSALSTLDFGAFERCSSLKTVYLPDNLTVIDSWTFQDCLLLEEIRLPKNLQSIGVYAFRNCVNLLNIYLGASVKGVSKGAFADCDKLTLRTVYSAKPSGWNIEWDYGFDNAVVWNV